jgi:hypothetical protein
MIEIALSVAIAIVVLPVVMFAGAQRLAAVLPRFGRWMDARASRISPRVGAWFRDETRDGDADD